MPGLWDMDHSVFGPVTAEKMPRFRRTATVGLTAAHRTIPAVTHHDRADISALETRRAALQAAGGPPLTALAFHVATLARSLQAHPRFNASLSPDGGTLWLKGYVSVGIAVETPHGLAVPVIREIPDKGLRQIADEIADLAERARSRRLQPGDTGGAGMTISNLGSLGGLGFTPIINPPEVAILGISRAGMTPVWNGESFEAPNDRSPQPDLRPSRDQRCRSGPLPGGLHPVACRATRNPVLTTGMNAVTGIAGRGVSGSSGIQICGPDCP